MKRWPKVKDTSVALHGCHKFCSTVHLPTAAVIKRAGKKRDWKVRRRNEGYKNRRTEKGGQERLDGYRQHEHS